MHRIMSSKRNIFILVVPGFLFFLFMVCLPIGMSAYYGMTDWKGIGSYQMVGLENYINIIMHDRVFWLSLWNAILLVLATVLLQHPIAIFLAILLTHLGRWEKLFRVLFFIPAVISIVVTSKLWSAIYHPNFGLLNKVLDTLGLGMLKQEWLGDPNIAIWSLIITIMWQGFGYALLLYYAGLQGIPNDLYEAAKLDGASNTQLYLKIVVPLLMPMIRVAVVLAVITCLKQMETVYLMTNGGPGDSTQFLGNYVYKAAFSSSLYGYGNAISVLFVIFCLVLTAGLNKLLKKDVGEF